MCLGSINLSLDSIYHAHIEVSKAFCDISERVGNLALCFFINIGIIFIYAPYYGINKALEYSRESDYGNLAALLLLFLDPNPHATGPI